MYERPIKIPLKMVGNDEQDVKYEVSSPMPGLNPDFHRLENYMDVQ